MTNVNKRTLYSGNLSIEYGQFYIESTDDVDEDYDVDMDEMFEDQNNGLCGASEESRLFFIAGIQNGTIGLNIETYESEPPLLEDHEEAVEVSFVVGQQPMSLCEWAHEATHELDISPGTYRLRYSIKGMDLDYGDDDDWEAPVPNQRHTIELWPSEPDGDRIVKTSSESATYWHTENGSGV